MSTSRHLFFLMNHLFVGVAIAVTYGALTGLLIWKLSGEAAFAEYLRVFFQAYNGAIVGGLIFSTAILIYRSQRWIPNLIESNFSQEELAATEYPEQKRRFLSAARSAGFATTFVVISFGLFAFAKFPFSGFANYALVAFGCVEYALGVYIGRKLFYIAQMLHAIERLDVKRDIFTDDKLGMIAIYVNSLSTLTAAFVFAHVYAHYYGPFQYTSTLGAGIRVAMLLPAVLALPVVGLFNFYPRAVLSTLYGRSIRWKIDEIKNSLKDAKVTEFERLSYLIEYDKISRDELRYRLRATLSDLPIAITVILMIIGVLVK